MKLSEKIKVLWQKFKNFCKGIWDEVKDVKTLILFIIVVIIAYSPVWVGYILYFIFKWKWCLIMATAYLAFWAGPFTPFFPLCIVVTLFVKRKFIDKKKGINKKIDTNNLEVNLQKATDKDFKKIEDFYKFVIDNDENMPIYCRWVYGLHPSAKLLHRYIDEGAMYYAEKDGEILSSVVILPYQEEDYHDCNWKEELKDDEVVALHLLCSNPKYKRTGLGSKTMAEVERIAKEAGKKAVRLDTLESNLAAQAFYPSLGYEKRDVKSWHADNTGVTNFILFEKML